MRRKFTERFGAVLPATAAALAARSRESHFAAAAALSEHASGETMQLKAMRDVATSRVQLRATLALTERCDPPSGESEQ